MFFWFKTLCVGTVQSVLVFFAFSFVQVLFQMTGHAAILGKELRLGFPYNYYYHFEVDGDYNHGWIENNLMIDCMLFWIIVTSFYALLKWRKVRH